MTAPFQALALAQVQPGMVLSDDLHDPAGHVLLPRGTTLTAAMLASMPRHHVGTLAILLAPDEPDVTAADPAAGALARQRLAQLFRNSDADSDPATSALRRHVERYRLGSPT